MWRMVDASREDSAFGRSMAELIQDTSRNLVVVTAGSYLALQVILAALASDQLSITIWLMTPILAVSSAVALHLLPTRMLLAQAIWQLGLAVLISVALYLFRRTELAFLYVLLPFITVITAGAFAGIVVQLVIVGVALVLAYHPAIALLSPSSIALIIAGGLFTFLVGWTASRTLYTVTGWSLQAFAQAQRNMEQARKHRAQLAQILKDLDQAYYRLERTNAALVAAWRAASAVEQFKAEFATTLSHELRTPLNLIIGFAELMLTAPQKYDGAEIPQPYRVDLGAIYHNARHLDALVNDVLDLARIDAGHLALAHDEVDVSELIEEVVGMVRDYVVAKGLELGVILQPDLPRLCIDRLRMRQVLLNLLVNAARFTESGWIHVEAARRDGEVILRVSDTGRGISEHDRERIFEEFGMSGRMPSSVGWVGGTGLGLPISRKLVELHGGTMGVESAHTKGTTFWFTLPIASREPQEPQCFRPLERPKPLPALRSERRVLVVVHHDARIVHLLQRYLQEYRLIHAEGTDEAGLLALRHEAVALLSEVPVPLSHHAEGLVSICCPLPNVREAAQLVGAHDLLVKPIRTEDLWRAIDGLGRPVRSILIADDDPDMVRLLRRMLVPRIAPQDCYGAYNGEEAFAQLRAQRPDLVVLDLAMPKMGGEEVIAAMAQEPDLADIAVIVVSAREQSNDDFRLTGPVQFVREGGVGLNGLGQLVKASLNVLAPGWH